MTAKRTAVSAALPILLACRVFAQAPTAAPEPSGTSTDLFIMFGSDLVRPGLLPKANYNIGIGHTFAFLKKDPFGDELTFSYTYENAGSHGFLHTEFGAHTEALGLMKNFSIAGSKRFAGYTWVQGGLTSSTGNANSPVVPITAATEGASSGTLYSSVKSARVVSQSRIFVRPERKKACAT